VVLFKTSSAVLPLILVLPGLIVFVMFQIEFVHHHWAVLFEPADHFRQLAFFAGLLSPSTLTIALLFARAALVELLPWQKRLFILLVALSAAGSIEFWVRVPIGVF
jgi:hypothetical protein